MQTGACLECVKDFEILTPGAACTKKIVIENCQVPDTKNVGRCLICNTGFFPEGTRCSKVSELCKDYNGQNGRCTSCVSPGFNLNDGKCVDPNCATRNGELCTGCSPNFELNRAEKICKLVDPNCNRLAIASCLECKTGYYISSDKTCKLLPANCLNANEAGACLSCASGFEVNRGGCLKVVMIPNCQSVDSANNRCLNCNDRFYSAGSGCASVSPLCNTYNSNNGWCLTCKPANMVVQADGSCAVPPRSTTTTTPSPTTSSSTNTVVNIPISAPSTLTILAPNNQPSGGSSQPTTIRGTVISDLNCREYSGPRCVRCSTRYYVNQ